MKAHIIGDKRTMAYCGQQRKTNEARQRGLRAMGVESFYQVPEWDRCKRCQNRFEGEQEPSLWEHLKAEAERYEELLLAWMAGLGPKPTRYGRVA